MRSKADGLLLGRDVEEEDGEVAVFGRVEEDGEVTVWMEAAEPVRVGIAMQSNPRSSHRKEVIAALRAWLRGAGSGWSSWGLDDEHDDEHDDCGIEKRVPLQTFVGGDDHVRAIRIHLLSLIDEAGDFLRAQPDIPINGEA